MYYQRRGSSPASGSPRSRVGSYVAQGNPIFWRTSAEQRPGGGCRGDRKTRESQTVLQELTASLGGTQEGAGQRGAWRVDAAELRERERACLAGVTKEGFIGETGLGLGSSRWVDFCQVGEPK